MTRGLKRVNGRTDRGEPLRSDAGENKREKDSGAGRPKAEGEADGQRDGERAGARRDERRRAGPAGGSGPGRERERPASVRAEEGRIGSSHPAPERSYHPAVFSLVTGLFAGLFWGFVRWFAVSLHFTKVPQAFLADAWVRRSALGSAGWQWLGLALFAAMSIVAALLYWLLLGRLRGPWPGMIFGAAWWAMLFLVIGPPTGTTDPVRSLGWNSIITELCLYVVWGLFIGYSYAFEFHDEAGREPAGGSGGDRQPEPAR